jgi:hypothetical protein
MSHLFRNTVREGNSSHITSCNIGTLNLSVERGLGKDIWILIALNGTAFLGHILSDCVPDLI